MASASKMERGWPFILGVGLVAALLSSCAPQTLSPDTGNGPYEVLFVRGGRLFAVQPDGADERAIAPWLSGCREPQGSPDGQHIAVVTGSFIYVMERNGANAHAVAGPVPDSVPVSPNWSPDGRTLAFTGEDMKPRLIDLDQAMQPTDERVVGRASGYWPTTPTFFPVSSRLIITDYVGGERPGPSFLAPDGTGYEASWLTYMPPFDYGWSFRLTVTASEQALLFENDIRGGYDIYMMDMASGWVTCITGDDKALEEYDPDTWNRNVCARLTPDQQPVFESNRPVGDSDERISHIWLHDWVLGARRLTSGPEPEHTPGILVASP